MGAHPPVDLLSQADLIDYAGDDPQVVDVLNFNLWLLSMFVHAPKIPQLARSTCGMWD